MSGAFLIATFVFTGGYAQSQSVTAFVLLFHRVGVFHARGWTKGIQRPYSRKRRGWHAEHAGLPFRPMAERIAPSTAVSVMTAPGLLVAMEYRLLAERSARAGRLTRTQFRGKCHRDPALDAGAAI